MAKRSKVVLYIASSLDGFIASPDGGIDWLTSYGGESEDQSFNSLIQETGALVMGSATYEFHDTSEPWPFSDIPTWVFTHRELADFKGEDIRFTDSSPEEVFDEIAESAGEKAIWLVGGGNLIAQFLEAVLIDEIIHFIAPKVLAEGIPLYPTPVRDAFSVESARIGDSGLVELRYRPASQS
jgi:dihydrofolate reductase